MNSCPVRTYPELVQHHTFTFHARVLRGNNACSAHATTAIIANLSIHSSCASSDMDIAHFRLGIDSRGGASSFFPRCFPVAQSEAPEIKRQYLHQHLLQYYDSSSSMGAVRRDDPHLPPIDSTSRFAVRSCCVSNTTVLCTRYNVKFRCDVVPTSTRVAPDLLTV